MFSSSTSATGLMFQMLSFVLLLGVFALLAELLRRRRRHFNLFRDLGIPGPAPHIIWGNLPEMDKKGVGNCMLEWAATYGDTYGLFFGYRPVLLSENREVIQSILLKNTQNFNREVFSEVFLLEDARMDKSVATVKGQKWKELRNILSPTFSGSKTRKVIPVINEKLDQFLESLDGQSEVNFQSIYTPLTMDVSFSVFTGLHADVMNNPSQRIVRALQNFLAPSIGDLRFKLIMAFPGIVHFLGWFDSKLSFRLFSSGDLTYLLNSVADVFRARLGMQSFPRKDLLQLMIDHNQELEAEAKNGKPELYRDILTQDQVVSNAVNFIFAGYETSKLLMSYASHYLIHHPDIQDKVRDQIKGVLGDKMDIGYDDLKEFHLLDQVLSETLRLRPPTLTSVSRSAEEDYEVLGKTIPKTVGFMVPLYTMHVSPKYWRDPMKFDPERFSPERKDEIDPLVYMPFGAGPRFCIGRKMALTMSKLSLAKLLLHYKLLPSPRTDQEDLAVRDTVFIVHPKNGIYGRLAKV